MEKKSIRLKDQKDLTRNQCNALQVRCETAQLWTRTREEIKDAEGKGYKWLRVLNLHISFWGSMKGKLYKLIWNHGWINKRIFEGCLLYIYTKILNEV